MPFLSKLRIEEAGPFTFKLTEDLHYQGKYDYFEVPAGYVTDFATVPPFLRWLVQTYGPYTNAAVVHDYLLTDQVPEKLITSQDADGIFRRIMEELDVPFTRRWLMWGAVRLGALFNPRRSYGRNFRSDALKVTGILLATLPFTLLGIIGVLVSLAEVWVLDRVLKLVSGK